jgi:ketosteroid isomerase-like protein
MMGLSRRLVATTTFGGAMLAATRVLGPAFAAGEETPGDAVEAFRKAMIAKDHSAFDSLCAAQLSYGHSSGKIQTKEEFILAATSENSKWKTLEFANVRNTVAGANAISRFTLNGEVENEGKAEPVSIGVLMVWQKQGDAWRLLARQGFKTEN